MLTCRFSFFHRFHFKTTLQSNTKVYKKECQTSSVLPCFHSRRCPCGTRNLVKQFCDCNNIVCGLFSPRAGSQPAETRRPTDEPTRRGTSGAGQQVASLPASSTASVGHHTTQEPLSDGARQRRQARLHAHLRWVQAPGIDWLHSLPT